MDRELEKLKRLKDERADAERRQAPLIVGSMSCRSRLSGWHCKDVTRETAQQARA